MLRPLTSFALSGSATAARAAALARPLLQGKGRDQKTKKKKPKKKVRFGEKLMQTMQEDPDGL